MFGPIFSHDFGKARMQKYQNEARERRIRAICSDSLFNRLKWKSTSILKFILSFRKTQWRIEDYPLRYCFHDNREIDIPSFYVEIIGWKTMVGFGDTWSEAYQYLSRKLEERSLHTGFLPRPGTMVTMDLELTDEELSRLIKGAFKKNLSDFEFGTISQILNRIEDS